MQSTQDKVSHLLWCILVALRTAHENHHIISENRKRKFIAEWLSGARRLPAFRGMAREFMTIRELLDTEKQRPIDDVLAALWKNAVSTGNCDLFRFRAVMNALLGQGWKHCLCPWPEPAELSRGIKHHPFENLRRRCVNATGRGRCPGRTPKVFACEKFWWPCFSIHPGQPRGLWCSQHPAEGLKGVKKTGRNGQGSAAMTESRARRNGVAPYITARLLATGCRERRNGATERRSRNGCCKR